MSKMAFRQKGRGSENGLPSEPVDAPTLVLLHGYAGSVRQWDQVSDYLEKNFRLVIPNLTHLSMGINKVSFSDQVDEIAHFLKTEYPNIRVHLCGISYGGALSWALASRYPELIERVVLVNPMPPNPKKSFAPAFLRYFFSFPWPVTGIYLFLKSRFGKNILKDLALMFRNLSGEGDRERINSLEGRRLMFVCHILNKFAWIMHNEDWQYWEKKLSIWKHKCLLIYETKDPLFLESFYKNFSTIMHCRDSVLTQGAGHISIVQESKLIAGAIREFLLRDAESQEQDFAS
jgi:pimeloyl-ACP methyl ester carboxylesterase